MELSNDWHKRTNVKLVDILSDILKETRPQKVPKPTHGYTIAEKAPEVVTAPGVYFPAEKGKVIPLESRQAGGPVVPTRTLQQMLEKLASYAPSPIPGAAAQSTAARERVEGQGEDRFEAAIGASEPKPPLVSRQDGGEVDPNLFKETFSVGGDTPQGIEAAANTSMLKSTPINVSPLTPSLQSFAPGANLTPTGPSTVNPTNSRLNQITGFLRSFMKPPVFKENRRSSIFGSDQRAAYDKKWKPYTDFMEGTKETPLFSRAPGGAVSPDPFEGLSEEERKRRVALLKTEFPEESLASSHVVANQTPALSPDNMTNVMTKISNVGETIVPKTEPVKQIEGVSGNLSEIKKDILSSGETRYTLPGTEGTATVGPERFFVDNKEVPVSTPGAVSGDELARQRILKEATPDLRLPERTYYEAHPEERFMDLAREENRPAIDAIQKSLEEYKRIAQGFGLSMNPKKARAQRDEAILNIPKLTEQLAQITSLSAAMPEKYYSADAKLAAAEARAEKAGTPRLVQNASGGYDLIYPSGTPGEKAIISPTGVPGKMPAIATPGRKSEKTFDTKTGQTYQQDFEWREGAWQPMGEKRTVGGTKPTDQGLKINKLNVIRKLLDEDYANQIGADVNDVQKKLSRVQKEAYNRILALSEKHAEAMEPRAALDQALKDWYSTFGQEQRKPQKQRKPLSSFEGK